MMAVRTSPTYRDGAVVLTEQWSNGSLPGEPAAGYTATDGNGTVTTQRALTADESAWLATTDAISGATANRTTLQQQAATALATNRTYVGIASPTNAQVAAQVKALTRQNNGIIRLLLNQLDGTD